MADNYLERKMEEYRSHGVKPMKVTPPSRNAFVVDGLSPEGEEHVKRLRSSGQWRVAFCGDNIKRGMALAQATGSRFYPVDPTDSDRVKASIAAVTSLWGHIDTIIP